MSKRPTTPTQTKLRLRTPLRTRLEKAARARGISMNAEIVDRLERSFQKDEWAQEVLQQAAGKISLSVADDEGIRKDLDAVLGALKVLSENQIALSKNVQESQNSIVQRIEVLEGKLIPQGASS